MKKKFLLLFIFLFFCLTIAKFSEGQCSICSKTTAQLGEKPARGMNSGILYLAFAPFAIVGFVAYRWWRNSRG